jgi:hypothetical protein
METDDRYKLVETGYINTVAYFTNPEIASVGKDKFELCNVGLLFLFCRLDMFSFKPSEFSG